MTNDRGPGGTMSPIRASIVGLLLLVGFAQVALAQNPAGGAHPSSEPTLYFQAGLIGIAQPAGDANHRVSPPLSGEALGITAAVGHFLKPSFAIEGEFGFPHTISVPQQFSYTWRDHYTAESRDVLLNCNLRWLPRSSPYLEITGGGGLMISRIAQRSTIRTNVATPLPPGPEVETIGDIVTTEAQWTIGGAVAVPLSVSRNIQLAPAFNFHLTPRSERFAHYGLSSYVYQFGVVVRMLR